MALYTTIHLHNVPAGREAEYAAWFDGPHRKALAALRGFREAERYEVTPEQMMPDIPQPWRYLSIYDFDLPNPAIDLPALGPLVAEARDTGLIADLWDLNDFWYHTLVGYVMGGFAVVHVVLNWGKLVAYARFRLTRRPARPPVPRTTPAPRSSRRVPRMRRTTTTATARTSSSWTATPTTRSTWVPRRSAGVPTTSSRTPR